MNTTFVGRWRVNVAAASPIRISISSPSFSPTSLAKERCVETLRKALADHGRAPILALEDEAFVHGEILAKVARANRGAVNLSAPVSADKAGLKTGDIVDGVDGLEVRMLRTEPSWGRPQNPLAQKYACAGNGLLERRKSHARNCQEWRDHVAILHVTRRDCKIDQKADRITAVWHFLPLIFLPASYPPENQPSPLNGEIFVKGCPGKGPLSHPSVSLFEYAGRPAKSRR